MDVRTFHKLFSNFHNRKRDLVIHIVNLVFTQFICSAFFNVLNF